jgi:hypothetical protein
VLARVLLLHQERRRERLARLAVEEEAMLSYRVAAAVLFPALALFACSSSPPPPPPSAESSTQTDLRVTDIEVGRSVAPDQTITDETKTFSPADSFYVAVKTDGSAPSAKVAAVWTYEDQRVTESEQTIQPSGPTVVTFQLPKPEGPQAAWPAGTYKVKILLNGVLAASETFEVKPTA